MALSNELSSEIAAAILVTSNKSTRELKDLEEVVFRVHFALCQMDHKARLGRQEGKNKSEKRAAAGSS